MSYTMMFVFAIVICVCSGFPCGEGGVCECGQGLKCRFKAEEELRIEDVISKDMLQIYGVVEIVFVERTCPTSLIFKLMVEGIRVGFDLEFPDCDDLSSIVLLGDKEEEVKDDDDNGALPPGVHAVAWLAGLVGGCGVVLVVTYGVKRSRSGNSSAYTPRLFMLECLTLLKFRVSQYNNDITLIIIMYRNLDLSLMITVCLVMTSALNAPGAG